MDAKRDPARPAPLSPFAHGDPTLALACDLIERASVTPDDAG
jgi:hypothetical protein